MDSGREEMHLKPKILIALVTAAGISAAAMSQSLPKQVDFVDLIKDPEKYEGALVEFTALALREGEFLGFVGEGKEWESFTISPYYSAKLREAPNAWNRMLEDSVTRVLVEGRLQLHKNTPDAKMEIGAVCESDILLLDPVIKRL